MGNTPLSKFAPLPKNIVSMKWLSAKDLMAKDLEQKKSGTNKIIVPKETEIIIGNTVGVGNDTRIPICKTIIVKGKMLPYFNDRQCKVLHSSSPKEYTDAWYSLGCPYKIDGKAAASLSPTGFGEIFLLRDTNIPEYKEFADKNAHIIPFEKNEFKSLMEELK